MQNRITPLEWVRRLIYGEPLTSHDSGQRQDTGKMYPIPQPARTAAIWPGEVAAAYYFAHPAQPRQIAAPQNTGPIAQQPKCQIVHTGRLTATPVAHVEEVPVKPVQPPDWLTAIVPGVLDPYALPVHKDRTALLALSPEDIQPEQIDISVDEVDPDDTMLREAIKKGH